MTAGVDRIAWGSALARGAFLACSWTWCIGMFMPVLLIADFGWPGWAVFAVPNVLGAIAMGLVLRRPGAPERLIQRHAPMAALFSFITIAFHMFFVSWMSVEWLTLPMFDLRPDAPHWAVVLFATASNPGVMGAVFAGLVFLIGLLASGARSTTWAGTAIALWLASGAICIGALLLRAPEESLLPHAAPLSPPASLLWLAPALTFGFAFCPYLDLTFLRTRREAPGTTGDAAFTLGFGVLFLAMIVLTLTYAAGLVDQWRLSRLVVAYMLLQSAFTVGAHMRELRAHPWPRPRGAARSLMLTLPIVAAAFPAVFLPDMRNVTAYWLFLGCYATLFPAYVWIVVFPRRGGDRPAQAAALVAVAVSVAIALPLFWLAFIEKRWWALGPGVGVMLIAPLALPRQARALSVSDG